MGGAFSVVGAASPHAGGCSVPSRSPIFERASLLAGKAAGWHRGEVKPSRVEEQATLDGVASAIGWC